MQPVLASDRQVEASASAGSRARLAGWIELDEVSATASITVEQDSGRRVTLSCPGFSASLDTKAGDWHVSERTIVLALGAPLHEGRAIRAIDLARLSESDAEAAAPIGGRHAIVIIDRVRKVIRLQTDRFSVWPLCWSREGNRLAFSDRADGVPLREASAIDPQALFDYTYFHMIPAPRTVFKNVFRVEPSTELRFDRGAVESRSVWRPSFAVHRQDPVADLSARFRKEIRDAVALEARDSKVGCFLSGGTDSSTVAGMLKETNGSAATFSIGFDAAGYDEMAYARIAARHFGTDHHEHYVTPAELVSAIPEVAAHYDQPFGNSSAVPAFVCASLARQQGLTKILAGDGGDELFGGNSRYAKQKIFEAWWSVPSGARGVVSPLLANPLTRRLPLVRKVASYVDQASVPMPARLETYNLLKRFGRDTVFTTEFMALLNPSEPDTLQSEVYARNMGAPFVDRMLAYDWRFTLADNDLPKVTGTTQMAGMSVGFPLLADGLVDVSTLLGPNDKVRGLRLRHFFKQSLVDFLPAEIISKKKHGFGLPVGAWLVRDAPFRNLARDSLSELASRHVILPTLVDDLFSRRLEEHPGYYGEMVWVLMMLEQWLAHHQPSWSPR